jgi:hypothetical protein
MRALAMCAVIAWASAGCLRSPEFRCQSDGECGPAGVCEPIGYCSSPNAACAGTGRSFGDSAGGLSNTCVPAGNPGPAPDAGVRIDAGVAIDAAIDASVPIDAAIDAAPVVPCPGYAPIGGSLHLYKVFNGDSWDRATRDCKLTGTTAYLAIPDDAGELADIVSLATTSDVWVGIDDKQQNGTFVTQKGVVATFLPWDEGQPDQGGGKDCVKTVSSTKIATERCGNGRAVVCECEP